MKTIFKSIFALAAAVILALPLSAREWHVSAENGSDQNEGTAGCPFKTISKAAYLASAGDSVIVHAGVYREWVSPENGGLNNIERVVYMAAPGENVFIKGSEPVTGWKKDSKTVWKAEVSNHIFGDFNPFDRHVGGDWLNKGHEMHLGEVYLEGKALQEVLEKDKIGAMNWFAVPGDETTVIYADFAGANPNRMLVEINARQACFYPKATGVDYITVKGFHISQACPQWAPPTAEQQGMVGPHWSKGWVIEDCEISNSKCVGISLGKPKASGHNLWTLESKKPGYFPHGFHREIEAIIKAEEQGWSKELVGSHLIQNNHIHDCGEAGIVGHLGGAFSVIRHNEIHDIAMNEHIAGAETGGIKLHAAIDVIIEDNVFTRCFRGIWLDWQTQGTQVRKNLFAENFDQDLFIEVSHGPAMVFNNVFLSPIAFRLDSQGLAIFNNIIQGKTTVWNSGIRYTPYHHAHSTKLKGFANNNGGDVRFYNNIFLGNSTAKKGGAKPGLQGYENHPEFTPDMAAGLSKVGDLIQFKLPVWTKGNVYFHEAIPYVHEKDARIETEKHYSMSLKKENGVYILETDLPTSELQHAGTTRVNTGILGASIVSNEIFENPDGSAFSYDKDFFGNPVNQNAVQAGPFLSVKDGMIVWE